MNETEQLAPLNLLLTDRLLEIVQVFLQNQIDSFEPFATSRNPEETPQLLIFVLTRASSITYMRP